MKTFVIKDNREAAQKVATALNAESVYATVAGSKANGYQVLVNENQLEAAAQVKIA